MLTAEEKALVMTAVHYSKTSFYNDNGDVSPEMMLAHHRGVKRIVSTLCAMTDKEWFIYTGAADDLVRWLGLKDREALYNVQEEQGPFLWDAINEPVIRSKKSRKLQRI